MLRFKCPACREGDLFSKPFRISDAFAMPDHCPKCGQSYFPEPGFYFGAMFVGYIVTAWVFMLLILFLVFVIGLSVNKAFIILVLFALMTFIYFFRFARSLWIHIAIRKKEKI